MTAEPLVGIWWDDGRTLAALTHPPTENASGGELIDSDLEHWREWPRVARRFGKSAHGEYFEVPRGRVMLRRRTGAGVIFHGNATSPERLREVATRFQLKRWESRTDEHYAVGPDADAFFENDEEF
jgi:hypothetical protein